MVKRPQIKGEDQRITLYTLVKHKNKKKTIPALSSHSHVFGARSPPQDSGLARIILYCSAGLVLQSDILTSAPFAERRHLWPDWRHCSSARRAATLPWPCCCKYFRHRSIMDEDGWRREAEEADGTREEQEEAAALVCEQPWGGGLWMPEKMLVAQRDLLTCSQSNYAGYSERRLGSRSELLSRQAQQS